jgi:hypothetical protein
MPMPMLVLLDWQIDETSLIGAGRSGIALHVTSAL